jgi:hypothetical protein
MASAPKRDPSGSVREGVDADPVHEMRETANRTAFGDRCP